METLRAYSLMLTIRFFEEAIERLFLEGRIMGTAHTCVGQEVVAVGVAAARIGKTRLIDNLPVG